ncbi:hypothetical protein [Actinomadura madurae]|uniref:hypothetical protein n=1 Tax=Actinomadura madurae TaxID=1993 RepID=UPI0020D20E2A|nr:hypothetical protein [Actinomadura madurae]MCP9947333.1 hypothetical protein [Actinomadura madurae]MCP9964099.1 hypothetical protein [Actinomadura madurae]MCP9976570.1 hypothetical protein [Actinomadura madurae]MCQ0011932.1 hypothetical protein [Actinomadura madurae]MCQ0012766.1 hypothetical protein [Actinomadura madurae]
MTEPMSDERLTELRDLNVDSTSGDAPYNPDIWTLDAARRELVAEVERLTTGIRDLYARCAQSARDNAEYYERVPEAKYEFGKATAWDGCAELLRELVPGVSGRETGR